MSNFKDFFFSKDSSNQTTLSKDSSGLSVSVNKVYKDVVVRLSEKNLINTISLSNSEKTKFEQEIGNHVISEDFISELSSRINLPKAHESEDEFVARAKQSMRYLLKEKFKK
ncbi:hypothetical protein [Polaromonas sp. CG_9.11]|uniref:hypothetical protein n=1 Tax=Polaromonas sp. CG_9.11 TaxID=2787730 RepID=UPI0018C9E9EF|nr:hypothetical protein [Polaromonas sp. CG_9.11]MBG6077978.1 fructose-1,6-bisphosphatase [Polaromonas sp. CG_9.11]